MSAPVKDKAFLAYLVITAVICGALIMVIEVLGSRVIGPFFGVKVCVLNKGRQVCERPYIKPALKKLPVSSRCAGVYWLQSTQ